MLRQTWKFNGIACFNICIEFYITVYYHNADLIVSGIPSHNDPLGSTQTLSFKPAYCERTRLNRLICSIIVHNVVANGRQKYDLIFFWVRICVQGDPFPGDRMKDNCCTYTLDCTAEKKHI